MIDVLRLLAESLAARPEVVQVLRCVRKRQLDALHVVVDDPGGPYLVAVSAPRPGGRVFVELPGLPGDKGKALPPDAAAEGT